MPRGGRRRAVEEEEEEEDVAPRANQRREEESGEEMDVDSEDETRQNGSGSVEHLSRGLVRYALACEFARRPIKRQDINEKVLGSHKGQFKLVFQQANEQLMDVFGAQMVELPKPDRVTMRQKRAAAASESQSKGTVSWILQTIMPEQYRIPEIIGPSRQKEEDEDKESNKDDAYVGLYTMVIALITISGGLMPEVKLDRALRRMNLDNNSPLDISKDKTLALMVKDGYIQKIKEDEDVSYVVGVRGKVEVGRDGVGGLIRAMYGESEDVEDLEKRIQRTIDIAEVYTNPASVGEPATQAAAVSQGAGRKRGRPRNEDADD